MNKFKVRLKPNNLDANDHKKCHPRLALIARNPRTYATFAKSHLIPEPG
jgi:hypothetical protein